MSTLAVTYSRLAKRSAIEWISAMTLPMALGVSSALACVAVRLLFRLLQWGFVQHMGSLPSAAETLLPCRRVATPVVGAVIATLVIWLSERFSSGQHFEEYVEAVRLRGGRIPFLSTAWRTLSSAFSVASGAAIGREGSMIQFATAVTSGSDHERRLARFLSRSKSPSVPPLPQPPHIRPQLPEYSLQVRSFWENGHGAIACRSSCLRSADGWSVA